jgi:plasmid stabilization system protein ParE
MKLTWTARARTRLAELHDYIAQDSKPRAQAMVERILDRAETLLVAPRSGVRLKAFVDDEVRELLERPYGIIYRLSATGIEHIERQASRVVQVPPMGANVATSATFSLRLVN